MTGHACMHMSGPTWWSAASFLGMWVVMMAAMMLPSLAPVLWRYRDAVRRAEGERPGMLTAVATAGYFLVWTAIGLAVYLAGVALPSPASQPAIAHAVPIAAGVVVVIAGLLQFSAWKSRHLACCRSAPDGGATRRADAGGAWRFGLRLGFHCGCACAGATAALLAVDMMDLRAMAAVTAAITLERLGPDGERVARAMGIVGVCVGWWLITRALGLG